MQLPTEQLVALFGVLMGYVGRMFSKETAFEVKLAQLQKDVDAAHKLIRQLTPKPQDPNDSQ